MLGVEAQFAELRNGLNDLVPLKKLQPFDERELDVSSLSMTA